jgi:hypothetical protein
MNWLFQDTHLQWFQIVAALLVFGLFCFVSGFDLGRAGEREKHRKEECERIATEKSWKTARMMDP